MLTQREIQLAQDVVDELRARGADEKAAVIERIVATAVPTSGVTTAATPPDLFTVGQAARALGVPVETIRSWANAGHLETVHLRGRVMIPRASLIRYLDVIRWNPRASGEKPPVSAESNARRGFVLAALPPEKVRRVRALTDKIEASQPLTPEEEEELTRLQDEFARISWERLKQWARLQSTGR
jgi:excisionase family DNA binding protein